MKTFIMCVFVVGLCSNALAWTVTGTGVNYCQDATGHKIGCPNSDQACYGQDANFRRPSQSFNLGIASVAVDTHTGLSWQRNDDSVQRNWADASTQCSDLVLDNHDDWRLPSVREFETLQKFEYNSVYACPENKCINTLAFPNTLIDAPYWTATVTHFNADSAWFHSFHAGGGSGWLNKESGSAYTRCVRGDVLPQGPFVASGDVVSDQSTGLMWEKSVSESGMGWEAALARCNGSETGGYTDWRLPDIRELESVLDFSTDTPSLDSAFTVNAPSAWVWSSSPYGIDGYGSPHAFGVTLEYGYTAQISGSDIHVLCVRGGQASTMSSSNPQYMILLKDE